MNWLYGTESPFIGPELWAINSFKKILNTTEVLKLPNTPMDEPSNLQPNETIHPRNKPDRHQIFVISVAPQKDICAQGKTHPLKAVPIV